jgi:glycosyltransferase involved in cell wall biosynthesis
MKIGWVAPGGFDRSGVDRVIPVFLSLSQRLARQNELHVFALQQGSQPNSFPLAGVTIHETGGALGAARGIGLLRRTLRAIADEHRIRRFDALHGLWAGQSGFAAVLAGRLLRVPVVVSLAGGELARLPEIGYGGELSARTRFLVRASLRLAQLVTAATEFAISPVRRRRPDAVLLPMGIDTEIFQPRRAQPPGPPWKLLQVAHLNPVKDQETLLRALLSILSEEPQSRLDIIGEDTMGGTIQELARRMGLEGAVSFRGAQPVTAVAAALRESHLLIHTSRHECGPVVFLEAGATGLPAVGTEVGYFSDLKPHAAIAVPVADHEALARETVRALRDEAIRERVAAGAHQFAVEHDVDWTTERLSSLYMSLQKTELRMHTP